MSAVAWNLDGQAAALERGLAGATPQRVGWFRFYFEGERWVWSDQVQRMHGYQPGTVTPPPNWCCRISIRPIARR